MLDQREITVGGKSYVIQQLPATKGMRALVYMLKVVSGAAAGVGYTKSADVWDTPISVGAMVEGLLGRLDEEASPAFIKDLVLSSLVPQEKYNSDWFDAMFAGRYDELWDLVEKIVEHNNLVEGIKKKTQTLMSPLLSPLPVQATRSTRSTARRSTAA